LDLVLARKLVPARLRGDLNPRSILA